MERSFEIIMSSVSSSKLELQVKMYPPSRKILIRLDEQVKKNEKKLKQV